jgi:hypothetical protein
MSNLFTGIQHFQGCLGTFPGWFWSLPVSHEEGMHVCDVPVAGTCRAGSRCNQGGNEKTGRHCSADTRSHDAFPLSRPVLYFFGPGESPLPRDPVRGSWSELVNRY